MICSKLYRCRGGDEKVMSYTRFKKQVMHGVYPVRFSKKGIKKIIRFKSPPFFGFCVINSSLFCT